MLACYSQKVSITRQIEFDYYSDLLQVEPSPHSCELPFLSVSSGTLIL